MLLICKPRCICVWTFETPLTRAWSTNAFFSKRGSSVANQMSHCFTANHVRVPPHDVIKTRAGVFLIIYAHVFISVCIYYLWDCSSSIHLCNHKSEDWYVCLQLLELWELPSHWVHLWPCVSVSPQTHSIWQGAAFLSAFVAHVWFTCVYFFPPFSPSALSRNHT